MSFLNTQYFLTKIILISQASAGFDKQSSFCIAKGMCINRNLSIGEERLSEFIEVVEK